MNTGQQDENHADCAWCQKKEQKVDEQKCKASTRWGVCSRKGDVNGYCWQHASHADWVASEAQAEPEWLHEYDRDVCEHGALMPNCPQGCLTEMLALRAALEAKDKPTVRLMVDDRAQYRRGNAR